MPRNAALPALAALLGMSGCITPPTRDPETADGRKITIRVGSFGHNRSVTLVYEDGRFTHNGRKGQLSRPVARRLLREADRAERADLSRGPLTTTCAAGTGPRSVSYRIHRMPAGWDTQGWNGGPTDLVVAECSDALRADAAFFRAVAAAQREISAQTGEPVTLTPKPRSTRLPPRVRVAPAHEQP